MLIATLNEVIPLRMLAADGRADLYAQIRLYNAAGTQVAALNADHLAEGVYSADWTPALEGHFTMVGEMYFDSLRTIEAGYEKVAEHIEVNSTKTNIIRILGLHHENSVVDSQVYDGNSNMTAARVRLYDSKPNALSAGATGLVATYTVSAAYDITGKLTQYRMVRDV